MNKHNFHQDPLIKLAQLQFLVVARAAERQAEVEIQRDTDMKLIETRILGMVGSVDSCPFKILTISGNFDKGHASRTVSALVGKGLMSSEADAGNKRATVLRLTTAGKRVYRQIVAEAVRRNELWLSVLPAAEREGLTRALATLYRAAAKYGPDEFRRLCEHAAERRAKKARSNRKSPSKSATAAHDYRAGTSR